jgi:hypothetical protein
LLSFSVDSLISKDRKHELHENEQITYDMIVDFGNVVLRNFVSFELKIYKVSVSRIFFVSYNMLWPLTRSISCCPPDRFQTNQPTKGIFFLAFAIALIWFEGQFWHQVVSVHPEDTFWSIHCCWWWSMLLSMIII